MLYDNVKESADFIRSRTPLQPEWCIILGSGLGTVVDSMCETTLIPFAEIPHFPQSTVEGHAGNLVVGKIGSSTVAVMQGRFHYYEGFTMKQVAYPVFVLKMLGASKLLVTNACGGINRSFAPGDLMLITDFMNLWGENPLIGENDERFGVRFPDMTEPYSFALRSRADAAAKAIGLSYQTGVYALFSGPCFETAAEIRAYERLGADAIGMSTVPETIAANYLGMEVLGISCVTNMATGIASMKHSHKAVLAQAQESGDKLCKWIVEILK